MSNQPGAYDKPFPGQQGQYDDTQGLNQTSSQDTAPTTGNPKGCKQKVMQNVRWVTALTGLGLVIAALFSFVSSLLSFSLSGVILCVYLCPIGFIISITETEKFFYATVIEKFPILRTHVGRGISYIFIAGLTISVGTIACWIVGVTLLLEGVVSIMFHYNKEPKGSQDCQVLPALAIPSSKCCVCCVLRSDPQDVSSAQLLLFADHCCTDQLIL